MSDKLQRVAKAIAHAGGCDFERLPNSPSGGSGFVMRQMYEVMAAAALQAVEEQAYPDLDEGDGR